MKRETKVLEARRESQVGAERARQQHADTHGIQVWETIGKEACSLVLGQVPRST